MLRCLVIWTLIARKGLSFVFLLGESVVHDAISWFALAAHDLEGGGVDETRLVR